MRNYVVLCIVSMAIGAGISRIYTTREVTKTVEHTTTVDKIITVTKERKLPNGADEIDTTVTDNRTANEQIRVDSSKVVSKSDWAITGMYGVSFNGPVYGAQVSHSLLGPIEVGAWALSNGAAGISVGIRF